MRKCPACGAESFKDTTNCFGCGFDFTEKGGDLHGRMGHLMADFELGLMSPAEFGRIAELYAMEWRGW